MSKICPLCKEKGTSFHKWQSREFYRCINCKGIFVPQDQFPDYENEKGRYLEHNNDVDDIRFQNFVSPITNGIMQKYSPEQVGLDFGSGTGSAVSKVLGDNKYQIKQYDPFFANDPSLLDATYDYIACCEVIEHFYNPVKEFNLLKSLLKPGATLYCMTDLYHSNIHFDSWYYKNDYTHVFIYSEETIQWVKESFYFASAQIDNRLITFSKH